MMVELRHGVITAVDESFWEVSKEFYCRLVDKIMVILAADPEEHLIVSSSDCNSRKPFSSRSYSSYHLLQFCGRSAFYWGAPCRDISGVRGGSKCHLVS